MEKINAALRSSLPPPVYLIGFMGCGKSTTGRVLASRLGYRFIELDQLVADRAQRSVREIFETEGEKAFRSLEICALRDSVHEKGVVVATGGGTMLSAQAWNLVTDVGLVVYLRLSAESLARRLRSVSDRPLLLGPDGQPLSSTELVKRIQRLLAEREAWYTRAKVVLDVGAHRPEELAERIMKVADEQA